MSTVDERWRELLNFLEVPGSPGLFVHGCFARRVTVYSQQVRALNLVDALAGLGYLTRSTHARSLHSLPATSAYNLISAYGRDCGQGQRWMQIEGRPPTRLLAPARGTPRRAASARA